MPRCLVDFISGRFEDQDFRKRLVSVDVDNIYEAERGFDRGKTHEDGGMVLQDDNSVFWRNIDLVAGDGFVEAEVSDNVHHFTVTLLHDGKHVTDVSGKAIRVPWITCPAATERLAELVGAPLADAGRAAVDQAQQCTHMLDLARLAIAQANRGGRRRYECRVGRDPDRDVVVETLACNGKPLVEWHLKEGRVISPGPFHGHDTNGRSIWSDAVEAEPDLREAGLIMRRAQFIFRSRRFSQPRRRAADVPGMEGACFSFQRSRAALAWRPDGFEELP